MKYEEHIISPEGDGHGKAFESANLDIDHLKDYLLDTVFEDENSLVEELSVRYKMIRREEEAHVQNSMTRVFRRADIKTTYDQIMNNEVVQENNGVPLSGIEPEQVLSLFVDTLDAKKFNLRIFKKITGSKSSFEYILQ